MRAIARLFSAVSTGGSSSVNRRAFRRAGFAFTLLLLFVASSPRDAGAQPVSKIGAATSIENEVEGRLGQSVAKLSVGSDVFRDQLVRTGKASTAELQFLDQTNLSLLASTEIKLDRFVYEPDKKSGAIVLNVPRGVVRFVTGSLPSRSYAIRTPLVMVGVRGTTFDVLVWPDRVTVLLIAGAVDLAVRPRRIYVLNEPNTAITIYRDGRVVGPRAWTGAVTDFANLALPATQRERKKAAAAPPPQNTAAAPPNRAAPTGGANSAVERLGG
ncbi:MAG TPA: FecR family protein, partial [Pseudorhodoplanes sp.]|nr:FecR family protein [Pseudorhodoplanes sp.]